MKKGVIGLCVISALFMTCKNEKENDERIAYSLLCGKSYILKIVKVAHIPDVRFPFENLQESDYTPTHEDIRYEIEFADNGREVFIEPGAVHGNRTNSNETSIQFELDGGLFAGGRFIIWKDNNDIEAEYTIYGSGIPIIKSERGVLEPVTSVKHGLAG